MLTPGLRPLDVGRGGDCLFKSVSHQLYGDSSHHLAIRNTALQIAAFYSLKTQNS